MTIISHVAAEFHDPSGKVIFNIPGSDLQKVLNAPEEIQSDPLFALLVRDGSLKAVQTIEEKHQAENDPGTGITAEGKAARAKAADASEKTSRKTAKAPAAEATAEAAPADAAADQSAAPTGADVLSKTTRKSVL